MAKIICITSGLTGILNASFELVNRLEADGHELLYASPVNVRKNVERQQISYIQLPEILTQTKLELPNFRGPLRKVSRWFYKLKNANQLREKALLDMEPTAFVKMLDIENPDLLIVDVELHEYIIKAYSRPIPLVILSQWFSLWKRSGLPYLLHSTIPGQGWKGQAWAIEFSWVIIRIKRWWTFFKQKLYTVGTDRRSLLLYLAKQEDFPLNLIIENNWPGPFTYAKIPVISMTAEELEFPHDKRPNLSYIGPMIAEGRKDIVEDGKIMKQLSEVFRIKKEEGALLIYCSVSSLHKGDHVFLERVIEAVASQNNWLLVIGMGGLIERSDFQNLPSNVYAFSNVPQLQVLKEADCSINHGGIHTINECIHFKVPMLIYSGKRSDQNGCAARIAFHGLGIMADKDKDDVATIESKIEKILNEVTYREKIGSMHKKYLRYKESHKLEETINYFLSSEVEVYEKI